MLTMVLFCSITVLAIVLVIHILYEMVLVSESFIGTVVALLLLTIVIVGALKILEVINAQ